MRRPLAVLACLLVPTAPAAATTLVNQIGGNKDGYGTTSNRTPGSYFFPGGDLDQTADDFTVPAGKLWKITQVYAPGFVTAGKEKVASARLAIYPAVDGKPSGDPVTALSAADAGTDTGGGTNGNNLVLTPTGGTLRVGAGHWFLAVQGYDYENQWHWTERDPDPVVAPRRGVTGTAPVFRPYLQGGPCSPDQWSPVASCGGLAGHDQAFRLTGTETVPRTLNVTVNGAGSVTSEPYGIACPTSACSSDYAKGDAVTLTANPAQGQYGITYDFDGWTGCPAVDGRTCTVTLSGDAPVTVGAAFKQTGGPTPTPTPTATASPTATPTAAPTVGPPTPTTTAVPTTVPTATVTALATPEPDDDDLDPTLQAGFRVREKWTKVRKLRWVELPRASVVTLKCKSKRDDCPFDRKKYDPTRGTLNVKPAFHGRKLRPGTVVTVRLDLVDEEPEDTTFAIRSGQPPKREDD